jgi:ribosomal-protein-alanine acetyltransferase
MNVRAVEGEAAARMVDTLMEISAELAEAPHWTREIWLEALKSGRELLIYEAEYDVAGVVLSAVVADEAEIESIAVSPNFQRQGVGRSLLTAALDGMRAKGVEKVHLELRESNQRALRFYRKHGFEEAGRRAGYYAEAAEDAILMSLKLG